MAQPVPRLRGLQPSSRDPESWTRLKQGVRGARELSPACTASAVDAPAQRQTLQRVAKAQET
jgi:hypothetical protein